MIEQYSQESATKNAYNAIKIANEKDNGVKVLQHIGDETYTISSYTSLSVFNQVANKFSDDL